MAVNNGEKVNEAVTNAAFISRLIDSSAVGTIDLLNTDSASGDSVTNIQRQLNKNSTVTYATESISAGGTVSSNTLVGEQLRRVQGNGGAITLSSTPFGATGGWEDGTVIILQGMSDTNTVTFTHNDAAKGVVVNGGGTLKKYYKLALRYDSGLDRWIEDWRNF